MLIGMKSMGRGVRRAVIFSMSVLLLLVSCTSRSFTKPRSQIIEEARSEGIVLPTIEEEAELYEDYEQAQQTRILALIKRRASLASYNPSYRVGPGDEIEFNVFDVPELNVNARVRQSGFISLPLVGAIKVAGATESEIRKLVARRLSSFVRDPQVTVFLSHFGSQKVAVMGAVKQPGTYSLKKGSNSIMELISEAGGLSEEAGNFMTLIPTEISGLHSENGVEARAMMALASYDGSKRGDSGVELVIDQVMGLNGGIPLEIPIRGGDMIIIPEAGKVMVEGEVAQPGSYALGQQMTLLGSLAAAGGITYGAKVDEVEIVRQLGNGQKSHLVVDLESLYRGDASDSRLRNGDIIRVPSDSSRRLRQDTFEGISRLINFGVGGNVNLAN